jgi:hypothetical protein
MTKKYKIKRSVEPLFHVWGLDSVASAVFKIEALSAL